MVCLNSQEKEDRHKYELWPKDFPKGLRVLLLYDDVHFATETKIKLEQIDYVVSLYSSSSDEALDAISESAESFHVAILEVTSDDCPASFKFLESAPNLPIIVASSDSSLNTMMKCISLGAAEFLQKPLSEEKLRNIWQHVVHKAFNSGRDEYRTSLTKSLQPIKEMVVSMLHLKHDENKTHEKLMTPSTPRLENKKSSFGNKEDSEERKTLRSAEKGCNDSAVTPSTNNKTEEEKKMKKCEEEVNSDEISNSDECSTVKERNGKSSVIVSKKKKNGPWLHGSKGNRKKTKVDWTPELHKKFVKAVEQLGIDGAIPSKILDLMKVEGLTRHNVASHLQKYRMHRRHISPKAEETRQAGINMRSYMMQRPILTPYPPILHQYYYSNAQPLHQPFAPWLQPTYNHHHCPPFRPWHVPVQENWQCKSYQLGVEADTWGCPVSVFPPNYYALPPRSAAMWNRYGTQHSNTCNNFCLEEEEAVIDKAVKEAMAEPWSPLPIGLTPPSADSVLSELHRLGIRTLSPVSRDSK